MQHEVSQRLAGLQHFVVDFDAAEFADVGVGIADGLAVDPDAFFHQQQAHLLSVEAGQVAEKTVDAHDLKIGEERAAYLT
jgi:hypothetical protein